MTDRTPAPSVRNRLVKGFAWTLSSRAVVALLSFISSIVLARLLMPEDFGLFAMAISLSAVVQALAALPLSEALIQTSEVDDDHIGSTYTLAVARAVLLSVVLGVAAWPIAYLYHEPRLFGILLAMAFIMLLSGFFSPRWALIQKQLSFGPSAVQSITLRMTNMVVALPIAYFYRSVWAIIIGMIAAQIVSVTLTHCYAPAPLRFSTKRIRAIWSFSVWGTFSGILNTINQRIDTLMIGSVLGHREVGLYWYADDKAVLPTREITTPLVVVLFPGLSRVKDDPVRLATAYRRAQSLLFAACVPAGVGFGLVADQFVNVLLGEKWLPIIPIIQILAPLLALEALIASAKPLAMANGRTRDLFRRDLMNFAFRTPVVLAGLFLFGLPGVLAARAVTTIYGIGLFMWLVRKITGITLFQQLHDCRRSFGALAIMAAGIFLFKAGPAAHLLPSGVMFMVTIAVGGLCYVAGHLLLWLTALSADGLILADKLSRAGC
ncbi:MAG: lipopolysaccharide biosynthesis protein [Sphingomonadales bacterium]|nr:lipopolysaccharide biosynthesis protein [Sphingomonadales bacterium]